MRINYNFGKPQSIFRLKFDEPVDVSEFRMVYMWIYNLMTFLNFRKDISLGEIELEKRNEKDNIEQIGDVYLNEKEKKDITNIEKIIGYRFVFDHIDELLQIVNRENLNLLFIPRNEKEGMYISAEKYMICCTSFESVFNFAFPNAKTENSQKANEVKSEFLEYIEAKRNEYRGKDGKKRKEFQKYAAIINLLDFSLEEKFDYCNSKYGKCVDEYKKAVLQTFTIEQDQLQELSAQFAKKRNLLIHSSMGEFDSVHIFAYLLARAFIYAMILDKANIDSLMISQAIDKIL